MDTRQTRDGFDPHADEARQRWGSTGAYRESQRRTRGYSKDDWRTLKAESEEIMTQLAAAFRAGKRPGDAGVAVLAGRHRLHIDRWFYPCPPRMHEALAGLYESDPRFAASIDRYAEGLTGFLVAAIRSAAGTEPAR